MPRSPDDRLSGAGVYRNSRRTVSRRLYLRTAGQTEFVVEILPSDRVQDVKALLVKQYMLPREGMQIVWAGAVMTDTMGFDSIPPSTTLLLVAKVSSPPCPLASRSSFPSLADHPSPHSPPVRTNRHAARFCSATGEAPLPDARPEGPGPRHTRPGGQAPQ